MGQYLPIMGMVVSTCLSSVNSSNNIYWSVYREMKVKDEVLTTHMGGGGGGGGLNFHKVVCSLSCRVPSLAVATLRMSLNICRGKRFKLVDCGASSRIFDGGWEGGGMAQK